MSETPDFYTAGRDERDSAVPRFFMEAVQNKAKSAAEGRAVFDEREMVEVIIPGDRKTVSVRYVSDEHRNRWPRQYQAFKAGQEAPVSGTPIREWPFINRAQAEELAYAHVLTVEQLAGLTDDLLLKAVPRGGYELRSAAQRFLDAAKSAAPSEQLAAELAERDATIAAMKELDAAKSARLDALEAQMATLLQAQQPQAAQAPVKSGKL